MHGAVERRYRLRREHWGKGFATEGSLALVELGLADPDLTCVVEVGLPPGLGLMARLSLLGHFLGRHVAEEARGFAADIGRKLPVRR